MLPSRLKHWFRALYLYGDSRFFGRSQVVVMPNGKTLRVAFSSRDAEALQAKIIEEIGGYWREHPPQAGETHLDVGAEVGLYTLLAASCGATVFSFEPDPNNRRFLGRNLRANELAATVIPEGAWNKPEVVSWRSQTAMSSIPGVGMLSTELPALDHIRVDTIDHLVERMRIPRVNVIKMDIEGAEIEAIRGAQKTITTHRPLMLIEAYHLRDGMPTAKKVLATLREFGIPDPCIRITDKTLLVVSGY